MSVADSPMFGKFNSLADVKMYQTLWQASTFEPAWKSLREHVSLPNIDGYLRATLLGKLLLLCTSL